jgi:hypothetical protein
VFVSHVFISYAQEDAAIAVEIARTIEATGVASWYYQRDNCNPVPSYITEILKAIQNCQAMVAVISPHLIASQHADLEFHKAYELDKRIIPLLRGIDHEAFQKQKPEWEAMLRGSTTIQIRGRGAKNVLPDVLEGLRKIGVSTGGAVKVKSENSSSRKTTRGSAVSAAVETPPPEPEPQPTAQPEEPTDRMARWRTRLLVPLSVVVVIVVVTLINRLIPPKPIVEAITPNPSQSWSEAVRTAEWMTWRQKIHEKLADTPASEADIKAKSSDEQKAALEKLVEDAFRIAMPSDRHANVTPAAIMRRDQAVADALVSYPAVRWVLSRRFGIYDTFLGTGLSNPTGSDTYAGASVHEYLVPNEPESEASVWTFQIKESEIAIAMQKRIRELFEIDASTNSSPLRPTNGDGPKKGGATFAEYFKTVIQPKILERGSSKTQPVIRFKRLANSKYSKKLGRPDAYRVFASSLSEVWDMKLEDAAKMSGYYNDEGDTFFIWIYVPVHDHEFVPATWRQVLTNLPTWMAAERDKK